MTKEYANVQASLEDALAMLKQDWETARIFKELHQMHPEDMGYERMAHDHAIKHVQLQLFVCDLFGVELDELIDYEISIRRREC